jgi:hypothetical protein
LVEIMKDRLANFFNPSFRMNHFYRKNLTLPVGKSHLSQALGNEACLKNIDVMYRGTHELLKWINAGRADGIAERRMQIVRSVPLLILDDFGLRPLSDVNQSDLYEIISARYEKRSTILTSNRDFAADSGENCHPFRLKTATPGQCDQPLVIGIPGGRFGSRITV